MVQKLIIFFAVKNIGIFDMVFAIKSWKYLPNNKGKNGLKTGLRMKNERESPS